MKPETDFQNESPFLKAHFQVNHVKLGCRTTNDGLANPGYMVVQHSFGITTRSQGKRISWIRRSNTSCDPYTPSGNERTDYPKWWPFFSIYVKFLGFDPGFNGKKMSFWKGPTLGTSIVNQPLRNELLWQFCQLDSLGLSWIDSRSGQIKLTETCLETGMIICTRGMIPWICMAVQCLEKVKHIIPNVAKRWWVTMVGGIKVPSISVPSNFRLNGWWVGDFDWWSLVNIAIRLAYSQCKILFQPFFWNQQPRFKPH